MKYGYSAEETEDLYIGRVFSLNPVKQLLMLEMSKSEEKTRVLDLEHGKFSEIPSDFPTLKLLVDYLIAEKHVEPSSELYYFHELDMKDIDDQ